MLEYLNIFTCKGMSSNDFADKSVKVSSTVSTIGLLGFPEINDNPICLH